MHLQNVRKNRVAIGITQLMAESYSAVFFGKFTSEILLECWNRNIFHWNHMCHFEVGTAYLPVVMIFEL